MPLRFGSVCSGVEAASLAWNPLGWEAAWFAEIEPFPCAVLAHHYPDVPNYGDMTTLPERIRRGEIEAPDLLCGGTPCVAFSYAGQRKSLDDPRGLLSLVFCELLDAIDSARSVRGLAPAIAFWENVPGVLHTKDNAFGCFLAGIVGSDVPLTPGTKGDRWPSAGMASGSKRRAAWRVLDAQFFGVPQRRRRVYLVASDRDGIVKPEQILFERTGLCGDSQESKETWQSVARRTQGGSADDDRAVRGIPGDGLESSARQIITVEGGGISIKAFREGSFGTFVPTNVAGTCKAVGGVLGGGSETLLLALRNDEVLRITRPGL